MDDLINRKETIRAWCLVTCGREPEECGLSMEWDGAEMCEFVDFLWNIPGYDHPQCFLREEDEDE